MITNRTTRIYLPIPVDPDLRRELFAAAARVVRESIEEDLDAELIAFDDAPNGCAECGRSYGPHYAGPCYHV